MSHKAVHDKKPISLCDDNTIIKADLAYFDDNGRKIMDTVWLDVLGVRDGDYIQLYTGADGDGLFLNYKTCKEVATQEDFDKF